MRGLTVERRGHGPRLVLVHGFTQTGRSWATIARDLATDHEVVLVDAPGHGGSSEVRVDLVAGAEHLADAGGAGTYVGYSMGGRLALHAALAHPATVRRLVLLGATPGIQDPAERATRLAADEELACGLERDGVDAFLERWLASPMFAGLDADAAGLAERRRNTVEGLAASLRLAGTGAQADLWPRVGELTMPVLLLTGERDEKFSSVARRMADAIGPNATAATIPGAGHPAHLERPAEFVGRLRVWLTTPR